MPSCFLGGFAKMPTDAAAPLSFPILNAWAILFLVLGPINVGDPPCLDLPWRRLAGNAIT